MNEELLNKMKKVKNNLNSAKNELRYIKGIINDSILINDLPFKDEEIFRIETKLDTQINNLNEKIIPKIKNM